MKRRGWLVLLGVAALVAAAALAAVAAAPMVAELQDIKTLRYEAGAHMGAAYCDECHVSQYEQWSTKSRHALATASHGFNVFKEKLENNFLLNLMMGEAACYSCHGPKTVDEGVSCETCHGPAIVGGTPEETWEESHSKRYTPGMTAMREAAFCGGCHQITEMFTTYSEWQASEAAKKGMTCQSCHMEPREEGGGAYHGFDTAYLDVGIYEGDLELTDVRLDFPQLFVTVVNRVEGHALPAVGPSTVMTLEIDFYDRQGNQVHTAIEEFAKYFSLMAGLMPQKMLRNTQLQSGEARELQFTLPGELENRVGSALFTMRFYEISDEFQGALDKAHWVSSPILEFEVRF